MLIRKATENDFEQLKELLKQLTVVGDDFTVNKEIYNNIFVISDNDTEKIIGCATLLIEDKIIHKGSKVGHIEDVVIHNSWRKQGIGKLLIDHCVEVAKKAGCYKVILDCDTDNVKFYEKCNFKVNGVCMRLNLH